MPTRFCRHGAIVLDIGYEVDIQSPNHLLKMVFNPRNDGNLGKYTPRHDANVKKQPVIASESEAISLLQPKDCHVATLLAMTGI